MLIKLSEYVAKYNSEQGEKYAFGISGGASLHLIHAINECKGIQFICPHHEQAAAMAADGYARSTGKVGVAVATSGPGATNLITGICCSYYDSVSVLLLTGQVSTFRGVGKTGVRQIGFQETPITDMVSAITKYCVKINDPYKIKYELDKAFYIASSGRPGPVLIDIPDNLQREMIDPDKLIGFNDSELDVVVDGFSGDQFQELRKVLLKARRPVLIAGWGLHLAGVEDNFRDFARALNIPVAATWGASNILSGDDPLYIGTFGTHGMRSANFTVQNADLVISLGSRLDTKATGTPISTFAREAVKVIVDIDRSELDKFSYFGLSMNILIHADLRQFFAKVESEDLGGIIGAYEDWFTQIKTWKLLDKKIDGASRPWTGINPYLFFSQLAQSLQKPSKIFVDTGCSIAWVMQAAKFDQVHSVFHDFNNTAMGWALPASIGSMTAFPLTSHCCVTGDGGFMMTMQELATIRHHNFPLKIFLVNNGGYSMIKQTQEQWLNSKYVASSSEDITFPDYKQIAKAFGLDYIEINDAEEVKGAMVKINSCAGPVLCNVIISSDARVIPQVKFGCANEDMEPLLSRDEFSRAMIIPSLPESC